MSKQTAKEKRELILDILWKTSIITKEMHEFLFSFKTFKSVIKNNSDKDLYLSDLGNDYRTRYGICSIEGKHRTILSDTVKSDDLYDKIYKIYPYTLEEEKEIKRLKKEAFAIRKLEIKKEKEAELLAQQNIIYTKDSLAPGKHKGKTWEQVKLVDPSYVTWMIGATDNTKLKELLESL